MQPQQKRALPTEIVGQIRKMIEEGGLRPGDRLPAERKLAELFQVSRSSVREGIKLLTESGLLESRQGAGTFVRERKEGTLIEAVLSGSYSLEDVLAVRLMLEPKIAALAARNGSPQAKAALEALLRQQCAAQPDCGSWADFDHRFHHALTEAAGNPVLREMVSALQEGFARSRDDSVQSPERLAASLAAHSAIVAAVVSGEPARAEAAMRAHLEDVKRFIFS